MVIEKLVQQHGISPAFLNNYFHKNAFEKFANNIQEFMFWRRGSFLPPHKKEQYLTRFMVEEIDDFYERQILRLPSVQFAVTTRCTLRCRDCSVMIPRFGGKGTEHIALSFAHFKQDFDHLMGSVDFVGTVLLVGGEPLLNKDLPHMLAYAAESPKVGLVDIVTNCTITPWTELLDAAETHNHKVFFGLSNYSTNAELAPVLKRQEIINTLKERDIKHTLDTGEAQWFRYKLAECSYTTEEMYALFARCQWRFCLYVLGGLLAMCPRSLMGQTLDAFSLPEDELIRLRGTSDIRPELVKFFEKDFLSACRYCLRHEEKVEAALQE
jgi:hypothetical protein